MTQQDFNFDRNTFNARLGEDLKEQGMALANMSRSELLEFAKEACRSVAMRTFDRTVTADDAARELVDMGYDPSELGNAAGSLFRGNEWEFTGEWRKSTRVSNHARMNRVWRLK